MLHRSTKPSLFGPPKAPPKPPKPLARKPMKRSRAGLSTSQREANATAAAQSGGRCAGCGGTWFLTPSHCFSQKQYPEHRDNALNLIILCVNCHNTFENNKPKFRRVCAAAWALTLERMELVDPVAFHKFRTLNLHLFT